MVSLVSIGLPNRHINLFGLSFNNIFHMVTVTFFPKTWQTLQLPYSLFFFNMDLASAPSRSARNMQNSLQTDLKKFTHDVCKSNLLLLIMFVE